MVNQELTVQIQGDRSQSESPKVRGNCVNDGEERTRQGQDRKCKWQGVKSSVAYS